ncbi:hypothetical protein CEXT_15141 [Caerostris extrusa]|uniref:Uncharacterized protein n=1 Tax=Caerostris extrusa TaxID=172846 RepID=A0AAV4MEQ1_CAEEX|nr:hypothetical protein CEXT_15141 [Caerostris extrusa]
MRLDYSWKFREPETLKRRPAIIYLNDNCPPPKKSCRGRLGVEIFNRVDKQSQDLLPNCEEVYHPKSIHSFSVIGIC